MKEQSIDETLVTRYLLGELEEEEQIRVEDRAFNDQEVMQSILRIERDLIDEFVAGGLRPDQQQHFEQRFLTSPERRRKVEYARAWAMVAPEFAEAATSGDAEIARLPPARSSVSGFLTRRIPAPAYLWAAIITIV